MSRPTLEVADIVRAAGNRFCEKHTSHFAWVYRRVLDALVRCRTAALGGHLDKCVGCGRQAISYNSCRDRNCPKCQGNARAKWLAARSAELLAVPYFHIVFTLPHELSALILQNKRLLYDVLFRTSAASLLELARDPKHRLVAFDNERVSFRGRDYAHGGKKKVMTVSADEFLRGFLLHILPKGLVRIRHFGFFANRRRQTALARYRELLGAACPDRPE